MIKKLPVVSNYLVFKNRKDILKNPIPFHHNNFKRLGDIFEVKIGFNKRIVFTRHAEFIKQILQKNHKSYQKSNLQTVDLAKYIGHGLLTANGDHWRTHRRMVQPAFHKKKLEGLLDIMQSAIRDELKEIRPNETQDVYPLMGDLAFQVVAKSLFSRNDIQQEMSELKEITETNQRMLIKEMRQPYLNWWYKLSGKIAHHLKLSERARTVLKSIITQRIEEPSDKNDLLDMLLKATYEDGTTMPMNQLIDEVLILFTAGHETTANVLSFTVHLLATNTKAQEKAYNEVASLDMEHGAALEQVRELTYIKQCIEEGMRLYPPAYYIDRECIAEDEIDGYTIPKNTMLLLAIYELHRDVRFWETPDAFIPERFDPEHKKDFSDYYFPFGAGPRMCVGNNFAMYEMVLTIAELLKKYELKSTSKTVDVTPLISLRPASVPIYFKER